MKAIQNIPGVSIHAAQQLRDQIIQEGSKRGQGYEDVQNLASTVSSAGFRDVSKDVFSSDRVASTRDGFNKTILGATAGMMKMFAKADGEASFWNSEAADQLHADATSELADGKAYYRVEINVVYARKAI